MKQLFTFKIIFEKASIIMTMVLVCLLLLEIGLRLIGQKPTNMADGMFALHNNAYRLKKNCSKIIKWPSFTYTINTNSYGFRDKKIGERQLDDKTYYIFFGTSHVFGNGVNYEESFVGIFDSLVKKHNIEILNMAIGGHRMCEQESQIIDFIENIENKPSKVIICISSLNMVNYDLTRDGLIIKSGYIFKRGKWLKPYLKIMSSNMSSVYCFFRDNIRKMQAKIFPPQLGNVPLYLTIYSKKGRFSDPQEEQKFKDHLITFEDYLKNLNITPVYIYLPLIRRYNLENVLKIHNKTPNDYDTFLYENLLEKHCFERNIKYINLSPFLKKHYAQGKQLIFKFDAHYNTFTNKIVGEYIYKELLSSQ